MRRNTTVPIILLVVGLLLCVVQAFIWAKATSGTTSETQTAERESEHPSSSIPGVAGLALLTAAAVLASLRPIESITSSNESSNSSDWKKSRHAL